LIELSKLDDDSIEKLAKKARISKNEAISNEDKQIKEKYWVS